jgi:hypothetical protein
MNKEDIIHMAREADPKANLSEPYCLNHETMAWLEAFAALVEEAATEAANARANTSWTLMCKKMVAFENEACARVAADYGPSRPIVSKNPAPQIVGRWEGEQAASAGIEAAIRARGQA